VKTTDVGGSDRGYDGGKQVKGRKRHILVDTLGLLLLVKVTGGAPRRTKPGPGPCSPSSRTEGGA
jgi:hypothetical protein